MNEWLDQVLMVLQDMLENGEDIPDAIFGEIANALEDINQSEVQPTEPTGTELLWQLSNANPDAFINYLRTVPDPSLNNLLRNPSQLQNIIGNLSQRFPPNQPIQEAGVEKAPLNSSNIWGFNYDPQSGKLRVRFQGDGVYEYDGVPPCVFKIFQSGAIPAKTTGQDQWGRWWIGKAPSLGSSFFSLIKNGGYPYTKVA